MLKKNIHSKLSILLFLTLAFLDNISATHILPDDFEGGLTVPQLRDILFMVGGSKADGYKKFFGDQQGVAFRYYARRLHSRVRLPDNDNDITIDILATISDNYLSNPLVYYKLTFIDPQGQIQPYCFAILRTDMKLVKNTKEGYEREHSLDVMNALIKYDKAHRIASTAEDEELGKYFKKLHTVSNLDHNVFHKKKYEKALLRSNKNNKTYKYRKQLKNLEKSRSFSENKKVSPIKRKKFTNIYAENGGIRITNSINKEIKNHKKTPRSKIQEREIKRKPKNLKIKKDISLARKKILLVEEEHSSTEN